jgi:hypothetical protein
MKMWAKMIALFLTLWQGGAVPEELADAWTAWKSGDIEKCEALLGELDDSDPHRHLLFLVRYVKGDFETALEDYHTISLDYARLGELDQPVIDAWLHLDKPSEALAFAKNRQLDDTTISILEKRAASPSTVSLDTTSVIPFADHELTEFFPAFEVELNGEPLTAHIDTGGTYLVMGPERAAALGITTTEAGTGYHGSNPVGMRAGIADSFKLGDATLTNVPVSTLASLTGAQDFVIFGTNVLQQFYSTLDYPRNRLILSPRGNESQTAAHRAMLPEETARMPFFLWADHYMFAKGNLGSNRNVNFFVDSGLVSVHPGSDGQPVQAAFTTSRKKFQEWGVPKNNTKKTHFQLEVPLGLGPLEQSSLYAVPMRVGLQNFGGVQIEGLISHAFLKNYAWTIDFDSREYIFAHSR